MKLTKEKIAECAEWVAENGLGEYGGATLKEFSAHFGIDRQSYYNWTKNSAFSAAIKKAKQTYKDNLEKDIVTSLARAAKGYTYDKTKTELGTDKNGNVVIKKKTSERVEVQPNVGAAVFLLTNIAGEKWKNKQNTEVEANVRAEVETENTYNLEDIPEDLLFRLADRMQDANGKRIQKRKNGKENN